MNWSVAGATSVSSTGHRKRSHQRQLGGTPLTNIIYTLTARTDSQHDSYNIRNLCNGTGRKTFGPRFPSIINFSANPPMKPPPGDRQRSHRQVSPCRFGFALTPGIGNVRLSSRSTRRPHILQDLHLNRNQRSGNCYSDNYHHGPKRLGYSASYRIVIHCQPGRNN